MYNSSLVVTTLGPVRGRIVEGIHTFKGLRYGRDTRPRRFLPPELPEPWVEPQNAFAYGPSAPQDDPRRPLDRALDPFLIKIGLTDNLPECEDCLFLNVWTPGPDARARPVMVWVHSGAFSSNSGSSPAIDGTRLSQKGDVVVVTFNHRLGVLGYTHLPVEKSSPYASSGNVGMLDIVAALSWVRNNISVFGGDPGNVTLFGQSGGAMKISALLAMPAARGLFHRAVLQSGATPRAITATNAAATTRRLFALLGLSETSPDAASEIELDRLMVAYHQIVERDGILAFGATIDGVVLPDHPFIPAAAETAREVPIIVGDLDTEATLFLFQKMGELREIDEHAVERALTAAVGIDVSKALISTVRRDHPAATPYELLARIVSGALFTAAAEQVAAKQSDAGAAPAWRYRIRWQTPVDEGTLLSPHEADVALVFGNVETAAGLNGGGEDARRLANLLTSTWLAFARNGSPLNPSVPEWPTYNSSSRPVLVFDPEPSIVADVDGPEIRQIWPLLEQRINWLGVAASAATP